MPGLVGIISKQAHKLCEEKIELMDRTIRHETFYSFGHYPDKDMFTYIGWTCHRNSFNDCMPVYNENRDVVLFLAGEVYSDADEINELKRKNHLFSQGDASYLVHLYEELDSKFFGNLNGCFSGVLVDRRKGKTFLFNDRYGMHRVFMHKSKDCIYFSSEAKALLSVLPETRDFDPRGLCELLTCGCTLGERSLFKEIEVLDSGSLLVFENGVLQKKTKFFDRKVWEEKTCLPESEFVSRFTKTLSRVTRKHFNLNGPVGISLTGGLDTRMVVSCLDTSDGSFPCYTFGSMYRDTFDVKVARKVAKECGQTYQVLTLGEDFLANLPNYLERSVFLSDGYIGLSGAAELYANSLARKIAPVRMTGNWGSELLRGVRSFKFNAPHDGYLNPDLNEFMEDTRHTFYQMIKTDRRSFAPFQQAPNQSYGRLNIERSQLIPRTPFLDNEIVETIYQAPVTVDGFALSEAIIAKFRPELLYIPTDRGFLGTDGNLIKIGRRFYREALFKAEYLVSHGAPDWVVRQGRLMRLLRLEEKLLGKHKFYHLRIWMRERLSNPIREILAFDSRSSLLPYLNPKGLNVILDDFFNGRKNFTAEIDSILTLALTSKLFFN